VIRHIQLAASDKSGNPGGGNGFQIALPPLEGSDFFGIDIEPQDSEICFTKTQNQRETDISHADDPNQSVSLKDLFNEPIFHVPFHMKIFPLVSPSPLTGRDDRVWLVFVERFDPAHDHPLVIFRQLRINRESQHFFGSLFRIRKISTAIIQKGITFLKMEGDGIIDVRADPFRCQELFQAVSFRNTDHILMKDMAVLILNGREINAFHGREKILK
jgi:hypothetical protein